MKDFSIIIPIYNCEVYLTRCINSIISQKIDNYEIILVNDGSTDNSSNLCHKFSKENKNIIVIDKENTGVSDSRNIGLEKAKGKYILFLDADDYLDKGYFEKINLILKEYPDIELINFGFFSDVDNEKLETVSSDKINYKPKKGGYYTKDDIKEDFVTLWDKHMLYNVWNKVYVKKIIVDNNIKFPKYNWGEDIDFNKNYLNHINSMYNSDNCFYHYVRERSGAVTKKYNTNLFEIRLKEYNEFNDYFESWGIPENKYLEFSSRRYIERVLGCIENIYCSNLNFREKYKIVKKIINNPVTRLCVKNIKPTSKKIKIMIIPIKLRLVLLTMALGKISNIVKNKFPGLFNKLKNRR